MKIPNDVVNRIVLFVARDATDLFTRETGLSSFTVYYVLDNGAATVMTGPVTAEIDATNMPGVYSLAIDEAGMTNMDDANDSESLVLHITHASMTPVTQIHEIYRPKLTVARTLGIDADGALSVCTTNTDMRGTDNAATETKQDIIDGIVDDVKSYLVDGGRIDLLLDTIDTVVDIINAITSHATYGNAAIRTRGDIAWTTGSVPGAGAITIDYYVYTDETAETDPIAEVLVWAPTDLSGLNVVASGQTDDFGKVTFFLNAGTYYFWRKKSGYTFTNPDTEIITS